jgi:peptide/nickel transport system substrate-binding protein
MRRAVLAGLMVGLIVAVGGVTAAGPRPPEGQLTVGLNFTIASTYLDPSETVSVVTSAIVLYAFHEALLKPLPGNPLAPALAESWTESPDGLVYEFALRQGLTFHNGDPFTAEDVKFSFRRYKGIFAAQLQNKVKAVEVIDAHRVRFVLQAPWPDFLTVYSALVSGVG